MRPPEKRNPAVRKDRGASRDVRAGGRNSEDSTTPALNVNAVDDWRARVQRDAEAFLHRKHVARRRGR